jgi:hypothetical protein
LEAVFNVAKQNDFIITCAFGGILQILKLYQQAKATRNRCKLKKIRCALAQADVLTKNAYNNAPLSMEVKEIAQAIQHYRQFEVVTALESLDMVNNQIRRHGMEIETILHCLGTNLVSFQKDFELMYNDFLNEPKRWEVSSDILGKKLTEIVGRNQQTRRLM